MVIGNIQIKWHEVWSCGPWDKHTNRQTEPNKCMQTWLTGRYAILITVLRFHTGDRLTITVIYFKMQKKSNKFCSQLASFIARFKWNWHEYHLKLFYCSLHWKTASYRQKFEKKWGGLKSWKTLDFKKWGGVEPRSLTEVYTYDYCTYQWLTCETLHVVQLHREIMYRFQIFGEYELVVWQYFLLSLNIRMHLNIAVYLEMW